MPHPPRRPDPRILLGPHDLLRQTPHPVPVRPLRTLPPEPDPPPTPQLPLPLPPHKGPLMLTPGPPRPANAA
ncbi:hypothetical protein Srufu_044620 [Streptomyces libani subsp. rufus]|nr:hypothetical protein Srufu_044620 [Streptomyces libani subsp. rufus]